MLGEGSEPGRSQGAGDDRGPGVRAGSSARPRRLLRLLPPRRDPGSESTTLSEERRREAGGLPGGGVGGELERGPAGDVGHSRRGILAIGHREEGIGGLAGIEDRRRSGAAAFRQGGKRLEDEGDEEEKDGVPPT